LGATGIRFRADIEGLRAVAVLLVILDHLAVQGFHGGFMGVDVFFVISGYLITSLLAAEYADKDKPRIGRGSISISHFYLRRARRILPAALAVIAAIVVAAHLLLNDLRVQRVEHDAVWAALFGSNINFIHQANDYFATGLASSSPFNHYWSLAVEEQFYFVWPVLFLAGAAGIRGLRIFGKHVRWRQRLVFVLVAIGAASFAWSVLDTISNPTSAYFSTFTRAWELALGALIALATMRTSTIGARPATAASLAAVALLVAGCVLIGPQTAFPGYAALLPTLGAGLLIVAGLSEAPPLINRILSTAPMRFTGKISYSLYLWHWPLIIFAAALWPQESTRLSTRAAIFGLTFLVSIASFYLIERPFRRMPLDRKPAPIDGFLDRISLRRVAFPLAFIGAVALLGSLFVVAIRRQHITEDVADANVALAQRPQQAAAPTATTKTRRASVGAVRRHSRATARPLPKATYNTLLSRWQSEVRRSVGVGLLPPRLQPLKPHLENVPAYPCEGYRLEIVQHEAACTWGNPNARRVAAITGDSHAGMWLATLKGALDPQIWALHQFTRTWCGWATVSEDDAATPPENRDCPALQAQTLEELKRIRVDLLIVSQDGVRSQEDMVDALRRFKEVARHVVLLGHTPIVPNFTFCLSGNADISSCKRELSRDDLAAVALEQHVAALSHITFIDPTPWFCVDLTCPPIIDQVPAFTDGSHISSEIAPKLIPLLQRSLYESGVL